MAEPVTLDLGRAAAYVRGMADAVRQALAGDPEQSRVIRLRPDFVIALGGRPSSCGPDQVTRACWPPLRVPPEGIVTIAELGDALTRVVRVADAIHQTLGRGGGGVTRDDIEEIGEIVGPPPL